MVFSSRSVDLFGRDDRDEDLLFARGTSLSGQFAQKWKLRMMAPDAALKKVANGKLRWLLARRVLCVRGCRDCGFSPVLREGKSQGQAASARAGGNSGY